MVVLSAGDAVAGLDDSAELVLIGQGVHFTDLPNCFRLICALLETHCLRITQIANIHLPCCPVYVAHIRRASHKIKHRVHFVAAEWQDTLLKLSQLGHEAVEVGVRTQLRHWEFLAILIHEHERQDHVAHLALQSPVQILHRFLQHLVNDVRFTQLI